MNNFDIGESIENHEFFCSKNTKSKGFSKLMCLVLSKSEDDVIQNLKLNNVNINEKNDKGWTSLMLACRNSNTDSNEKIVEILLSQKDINVNIQNNDGWTALMLSSSFSKAESSEKTVEIY